MCTSLFSSIIHIIRKVETDKWTNEIQYICIHIMWYYSVIKGMRCWYMQQYNKLCENLVKWTKPDIEPQILYDSTYVSSLEESSSERRKTDERLPCVGNEKFLCTGHRVSTWVMGDIGNNDDGGTALWMQLRLLNCVFKNG